MSEAIDLSRHTDITFESGERVAWKYLHSLNSKSRVWRTKFGVYHGRIRHTVRYKGGDRLAGVSFDGNKRMSRVPLDELYHVKEEA